MGGIYLIRGEDDLVEMTQQPYEAELVLQELISQYPRVLGGTELDADDPKKWLLVSPEAPLPSEAGGAGRWSMDHFFLDQDAIPTVVEVKRSSDTRIRREVVGQMLDYAAHAKLYLAIDKIRELFETRIRKRNEDPDQLVQAFIGEDRDIEAFWHDVDSNLRAGRMRMIFVADEVPDELRNVVEFLNSQMDRTEVLAIEVKQYVSSDDPPLRTLVPNVIGLTAEAQTKKGRGTRWNEGRFFDKLAEDAPEYVELAKHLLVFASDVTGNAIEWGTGKDRGSFTAKLRVGNDAFSLFSVYTTGGFTMNIGWNSKRLGKLQISDLDDKYRERFSELIGRSISQEGWHGGYGLVELSLLVDNSREARFESLVRDLSNNLKAVVAPAADHAQP